MRSTTYRLHSATTVAVVRRFIRMYDQPTRNPINSIDKRKATWYLTTWISYYWPPSARLNREHTKTSQKCSERRTQRTHQHMQRCKPSQMYTSRMTTQQRIGLIEARRCPTGWTRWSPRDQHIEQLLFHFEQICRLLKSPSRLLPDSFVKTVRHLPMVLPSPIETNWTKLNTLRCKPLATCVSSSTHSLGFLWHSRWRRITGYRQNLSFSAYFTIPNRCLNYLVNVF